jgi:hypothetical protein
VANSNSTEMPLRSSDQESLGSPWIAVPRNASSRESDGSPATRALVSDRAPSPSPAGVESPCLDDEFASGEVGFHVGVALG